MDPTTPAGSTLNYIQAAPVAGLPNPAGISNVMTDYGWEYVWHCHLLGHEENDMMRPICIQPRRAGCANRSDRHVYCRDGECRAELGSPRREHLQLPGPEGDDVRLHYRYRRPLDSGNNGDGHSHRSRYLLLPSGSRRHGRHFSMERLGERPGSALPDRYHLYPEPTGHVCSSVHCR